jgi:hypothetical protein
MVSVDDIGDGAWLDALVHLNHVAATIVLCIPFTKVVHFVVIEHLKLLVVDFFLQLNV